MLVHEQLREAREAAGLTQSALAALTGLARNQIVRAEAGENITLDTLRRIMVHLPLEEVTLLERVRIKVDYLNPAEKMFIGIGETLNHLFYATLSGLRLAKVAKEEMAMAQAAEGREPDEKEMAEDAELDVFLERMRNSLLAVDDLYKELYGEEPEPEPLKTKEIDQEEDPEKEG
jgi:transcriptional regulator with XRE-family HTH domain